MSKEKEFEERFKREPEEFEYLQWKLQKVPNLVSRTPSPLKDLFIWGLIIATLLKVALIFTYGPKIWSGAGSDSNSGNSQEKGGWKTICNTTYESNPNFIDDLNIISDNLNQSQGEWRRECRTIWVPED